jgi:hypothetical protein
MKTLLSVFALALALFGGLADAQTFTLTQTSLSTAALASDTIINVTSATNINAPNVRGGVVGSQLYVQDPGSKGEIMPVVSVSGTVITVRRGGGGTQATAHTNGAMVLAGQPNWFYSYDPQGACTAANTYVTPFVNTNTGAQWLCSTVTLSWVGGWNNDYASPTTTAAVASVAGLTTPSGPLFHITGSNAITGWNIPVGFAFGSFTVIPDAIFSVTATNNSATATTAVVGKPIVFQYDPGTAKFYASY